MGRRRLWATVLGCLGVVVLIVLDLNSDERVVPPVLFVVVPLGVALIAGPGPTAIVGGLALAGGLLVTITDDDVAGTTRWVLGMLGLAFGSTLAVWLADLRVRATDQADRLRQLTGALGALGEAVTITDHQAHILYANAAAVELLRVGSERELLEADPGEIMSRFAVFDERGAPVSLAELPGSRLLAGARDVEPMLVRNVVKATGEERWLLNKASLVPGDGGARIANVIEDLTQLKRAEQRQRLLAEATRLLAERLDYASTLQRVAEVVVPDLADWCSVFLPGAGPEVHHVALAHLDPDRVRTGHELDERYPNRLDDDTHLAAVLRGREGSAIMDLPEGAIEAYAVDAEHLRLLRAIGFGSILVVPLEAGGERLGAMALVRSDPVRRFGEDDVALAEDLARRAATAVLNARLYSERAELAATLQRGMLPPQLPILDGWAASALYHPAGEIGEVGGDFYEAFRVGHDWMVVIGDVAGHGPEAAALTAHARYTLRTAAELLGDPAAAIAHLNRSLRGQERLALCTAACMRLSAGSDPPTAAVASCGHPLPVLVRDGETTEVGVAGPLAGAFDEDEVWTTEDVALRPGDVLVLYTDGVLDALSHRGRRGEMWMRALIAATPTTAERIIRRLDAALAAEPDQRRRDDTAAVAVQLLGAPVSVSA